MAESPPGVWMTKACSHQRISMSSLWTSYLTALLWHSPGRCQKANRTSFCLQPQREFKSGYCTGRTEWPDAEPQRADHAPRHGDERLGESTGAQVRHRRRYGDIDAAFSRLFTRSERSFARQGGLLYRRDDGEAA